MSVRLTGSHGTWSLPEGSIIIGRGKDCGLCIVDPRLSRHHVKLAIDGHQVVLHDLESTNGVLLNGDRHHGKTALKNGDLMVAGPCTFFVTIDPTQPLAARLETLARQPPQPETSAHSDTEAMNPVLETPAATKRGAAPEKKVDPAIAAVLSTPGERKPTTDFLRPHDFTPTGNAVVKTPPRNPAIQAAVDGLRPPTGDTLIPDDVPVKGTSALTNGAGPAQMPRPDIADEVMKSSEMFRPDDLKLHGVDRALQAVPPPIDADTESMARLRWLRLAAGALDTAQAAAIAGTLGALVGMLGYGFALRSAGAAIEGGLPRLVLGAHDPVTVGALAMTLLRDGGFARAYDIANELFQLQDQKPFMILFGAATLSVLVFVLVLLLSTVAATVLKGAPRWHRVYGLVILEQRHGYYLGWGRAIARWALAAVLWPASLVLAPLGLRGLHDQVTGCAVCLRRKKR